MTDAEQPGFIVRQEAFEGTLGELTYALRSGHLPPRSLDLYALVRAYLAYFEALAERDLTLASEALPRVAQVVELKVRLLLPRPPRDPDDEEEEVLEETLEAVALLEELEEAVHFLRQRRDERRIVLPARTPRPPYPRPERPLRIGVDRLAQLASRYRSGSYFELATERLSMAGAMDRLLRTMRRLRRGLFGELLEGEPWSTRTVTFAGMLELVREGRLRARQEHAYGAIELELVEVEEDELEVA